MDKNKKLQLNKETIRNLSDESLGQVAGGGVVSGFFTICISANVSCVACSGICSLGC